jgi:transcriptional regulator with XRE-family HTH domain
MNDIMSNAFGQKLKKLRDLRGLSLKDVSRRMGFSSSSYVHDVENGVFVPPRDKLRELARALGVPLSLLDDLLLEARIEDLGIREHEFISMFKDLPKLSRKDKRAIINAYLATKNDRNRPHHRKSK